MTLSVPFCSTTFCVNSLHLRSCPEVCRGTNGNQAVGVILFRCCFNLWIKGILVSLLFFHLLYFGPYGILRSDLASLSVVFNIPKGSGCTQCSGAWGERLGPLCSVLSSQGGRVILVSLVSFSNRNTRIIRETDDEICLFSRNKKLFHLGSEDLSFSLRDLLL